MPGRSVLLAAVFFVCNLSAWAKPVHIALEWPTGMPASALAHAHIQAVWMSGAASNGAPVEAEAGPDGAVLDLGDGAWQVQAFAPGYWSQWVEVAVTPQSAANVQLPLWPAATLHGEIVTAGGEPLPPGYFDVRLSATPAPAGAVGTLHAAAPPPEPTPSHAELRCQIDKGTWSCLGPAGLFDVQMEAAGYAPRYAWGVDLAAAASTDLGRVVLLQAASVFGRAVQGDGSNPPGPCHASLQTYVERRGAPEPAPENPNEDQASYSVLLNPRGYFQLIGVPPGTYTLAVACPAASGFRELSVQADSETRIDPPMQLGELTFGIAITPKTDPYGKPWQITLDATTPHLRRIADKAATAADGRWEQPGLSSGIYRVTIHSSDGMQWLQQYPKLGAGSVPLALHLAYVRVAGRVSLSALPVRARMLFSNAADGDPVILMSDENGHFQGLLPVAYGAKETNWSVEAHVVQPSVTRRLDNVHIQQPIGQANAWLELALPTVAVRGSVVSMDGHPQSNAQVTFKDTGGAKTVTYTDETGSFEMATLPPGKYTAVAELNGSSSDQTSLTVVDGTESELKLVLSPPLQVTFHVVSDQGPVADATVQVWIQPGVPWSRAHSDQDGNFTVKLPQGTTEVGMTVGATGYALKLTRVPVSSEGDPSPDANTIKLDETGGTLTLDLKPPDSLPNNSTASSATNNSAAASAADDSAVPYLVHNGAIEDARLLAGWGDDLAGASSDGPATIEAIDSGSYTLCFLTDPGELQTLWQGALPPKGCHTASVGQGQTVTLTLSPQ
jgi:hypothetical protein